MIEILHEVYRFAEEIQGATQQVRTVGEIIGTALLKAVCARRAVNGKEVSGALWEIYLEQNAVKDPLNESPGDICLSCDKPIDHSGYSERSTEPA